MPTVTIGDNTGNTHSGTEDTQLSSGATSTNYGSDATMEVTKYAPGSHIHSVLKFTGLSNISGPVTVSAATLYLYNTGNAGNTTIEARALLRNWVEAQATWNNYSTGNAWGTAGGLSDAVDRTTSASGSVLVSNTINGYYSISSAQLAADVQAFINGTQSNYGWHIERQGTGNDTNFAIFRTSEGTDGQRPYLEITYTVSSTQAPRSMQLYRHRRK
jgi:hypothetical protein